MYEMQGPRSAGQSKLADCPGELVRWGNQRSYAQSVHHRSRTPAVFLAIQVSGRPKTRLPSPSAFPGVASGVVPVFAGREFSTPVPEQAQDLLTTNFKIL